MTELTMPKLSDSMEEGTILSWLKRDGDTVQAGEDLVEIETDKATVTHPAEAAGVLSIVAPEGTSLPVGATIARLGVGEEVPTASADVPESAETAAAVAVAGAGPTATSGIELTASVAVPVRGNGHGSADGLVKATPVARRVAASHGIELDQVQGSGPLGRITRGDVLRTAGVPDEAAPRRAPSPSSSPEPPATGAKGEATVTEPTRLQAVVARRMAEAKATIPHFQVQTDVVMDGAFALRAQLKESGAEVVPSVNDLIVKAAALALRAHPLANGAYRDGRFEQYARVNVGVAVAGDGTLVVPTIFDADTKSLGAIAAEARRVADRVRAGSVTPSELAGATFTVSNLGMYGMTSITPVINPPQAAILGVGAAREVLARVDGEIVDRRLMALTLSADHRILDGARASVFLSMIRQLLEQPLRLML